MCCGTATPPADAPVGYDDSAEGVCASKATGTIAVGPLQVVYTHVCGAKALLATAATTIAAAYLM